MSKLILIVEDQEDNRRILRDLLTSTGYRVIEAVTGEEGVASAETHRPDLILMDVQLRLRDGSRPILLSVRPRLSLSLPTR
jgi:two-component system cell cycle response regulator DivK